MKAALLLIDVQEDYLARKGLTRDRIALTADLRWLLDGFREKGLPVVHVISIYKKDRSNWTLSMREDDWPVVIEGTPGAEVPPELLPREGEAVLVKDRFSAFFRTGLDELLDGLDPDSLVIAGINTHACVRTTAIDAFMRDWRVWIPSECVASWDPEHHRVSLEYLGRGIAKILPLEDLLDMLAAV